MIVELNKEDLCNLLGGTTPPLKLLNKISRMGLGYYTGGFDDRWTWRLDISCEDYTEQDLWNLYKEITKDDK